MTSMTALNSETDDIDLAVRCVRACPKGLFEIQHRFSGDARRAMLSCRLPASEVDEALARMWDRLLVGTEGVPPKIGTFRGTGSLRSWLRRCAVREALSTLRRLRAPLQDLETAPVSDPRADPERSLLRVEHADHFREAFGLALQSLQPRQREVLRLAVLEGASSSELATRYGVHRVTVARWLAAARETLRRRTHRMLRDRACTFERLALSQLDVSLARVL